MADEEARDFSEAEGLGEKTGWVAVAALRFASATVVATLFLLMLITLNARFQFDRQVSGGQELGLAELAEQGGGIGTMTITGEMLDGATAASKALGARQIYASQEADQRTELDALAGRLQSLAGRARCPDASLDGALACTPSAQADATVRAEFEQTQRHYRARHADMVRTRDVLAERNGDYQKALVADGGALVRVLPAIAARDQITNSVPVLGPAVQWFFGLPLLVSSVAVSLLAGMFGAVVVLMVLLAFPAHAPLTFGGGKYFFLRMFTGGFVAVIVFMVIQSGITFAGVADVQSAVANVSVADPVKIALIGMFAGAFSDQLAGAMNRYVQQSLGGWAQGGANPPASPAPVEEEQGAMGPGAAAEMRGG